MKNSIHCHIVLRNLLLLIILGFFSISGCNNSSNIENQNTVTSSPFFIMAPNPSTPLAGLLELSTSGMSRVSVVVSDGSEQFNIDFQELNFDHSLPVLGFKPDKNYTITVHVFDEDGLELIEPAVFEATTSPLPDDFPLISVTSTPELMEPGVTLFEARGFLVMVNEIGEVVWFHRVEFFSGTLDRDVRRMKNGNLLLLLPRARIVEIDMLGDIVNLWHPSGSTDGDIGSIPVDTVAFHHEVSETEDGNLLVLSIDYRRLFDYPSSAFIPSAPLETSIVIGDLIVEFAPDGTVINEWSLFDILDPYRINYSSLLGLYDDFVEEVTGIPVETKDWTHGNAVIHDPSDDSIIVSLRHQDAVVKFSRQTGELIWILGPHENWEPSEFDQYLLTPISNEEFFFQYHQHAPDITDQGTYIIFDNGNYRASPFDTRLPDSQNFSRAVEYKINNFTKEVEIVWEYGQFEDETIFTFFIGDADYQPQTGNVLITFGGVQPARLIEVTRTTPAQKVFELSLFENFTYRSERLPSLYP